MRQMHKQELIGITVGQHAEWSDDGAPLQHPEGMTQQEIEASVMDFWVERQGARAAGWLVFKNRALFRRAGYADFVIPKKEKLPPWFRVAIETLKRSKNWTVSMVGNPASNQRKYRIRWMLWGKWMRAEGKA